MKYYFVSIEWKEQTHQYKTASVTQLHPFELMQVVKTKDKVATLLNFQEISKEEYDLWFKVYKEKTQKQQ